MATLYEHYNTGDDGRALIQSFIWLGQSFTPSLTHKITSVKLRLHRVGSPGTVTVSIRATDGDGLPTGPDLCSGTTNGNTLTTDYTGGDWREITLGDGYNLSADTKYVIVVRVLDGNLDNKVGWRDDESSPTYVGGNKVGSTDNDSTWFLCLSCDTMFEEWGETVAPTVSTQAATSIEATTARLNGQISNDGGEACQYRFRYKKSGGAYSYTTWTGAKTTGQTFYENISGLDKKSLYYFNAQAKNSAGESAWGGELSFTTKPAAPTNVQATDGVHADKVVVTWAKSTGATGYQVYRDGVGLGWLGDVATYDDTGAGAPTITPGSAAASDGTIADHVALSLSGQAVNNGTTHTYKVRARSAAGESEDSGTNTGYRGHGSLTYQWQRSLADSDADYSNISGATTTPYNDTGAPEDGSGRYYRCVENATGATQQISAADRGYRIAVIPTVTTQVASSVGETTATGNGNITDTSGTDCDERGAEWGTTPGSYPNSATDVGTFGVGTFTKGMTGLSPGTKYYYRAKAHNLIGWAYGGEQNFTTKPNPPIALSATAISTTQINLGWAKGSGAEKTMIRRKTESYPTSPDDGDQIYFDVGTSRSVIGLSRATTYYFRAWSYKAEASYSDEYSSDSAVTNPEVPTVTTQAVTDIGPNSATGNGTITDNGGEACTKRGVCWNTTGTPTTADNKSEESGSFGVGSFSRPITGLVVSKKYYVRAYAINSLGTGYGSQVDFVTGIGAPSNLTATTISTTQINLTWTKGTGAVNTVIRRKVDSAPTSVTDGVEVYNGPGTSHNDTTCSAGVHYYYRAWSYSVVSGYSVEYDTADSSTVVSPSVTTSAATLIGDVNATLNGVVADDGGEACQVRFQYGTTVAYGINTDWQTGKVTADTFLQRITGLTQLTTYHFRAQIRNSAGTANGADATFTTITLPTPFLRRVIRDVFGAGYDISVDNPLQVYDPKVGSLISYEGTTTSDGAGDGTTLICSGLTDEADFNGNLVIITSGDYEGQARDINGITTGGTVTPSSAFSGEIVEGVNFVIVGIRTTPAEVAAIEAKLDHVDHGLAALKTLLDSILEDTETTLEAKLDVIDGIVGDILVDTETTLEAKLDAIDALVDAVEAKLDKLAGEAPVESSVSKNWNTAVDSPDGTGGLLVNLGTAATRKKLHSLLLDVSALTDGAIIQVKLFIKINDTQRKVYDETFTIATDPDGLWIVNGTVGLHDILSVAVYSDNSEDVAIGYTAMLEAM